MKPPAGKLDSDKSIRSRGAASLDVAWAMVWGSGALLFSVSAIAAFVLSGNGASPDSRVAGLALPPLAGEIAATGAIVQDGETVDFAVYPSEGGLAATQARVRLQAELDVLRREVVGLRRALDSLQERDRQISERIHLLEQGKPSPTESGLSSSSPPQEAGPANVPPAPRTATGNAVEQRIERKVGKPETVETEPAPESASIGRNVTERGNPERVHGAAARAVRIVALPPQGDAETVGSIPKAGHTPGADRSDISAPAFSVSPPAGTFTSDKKGRLARTDFAVDLGVFPSADEAVSLFRKVQAEFDKLGDKLAPRLAPAPGDRNAGTRLLVGPFANAADAAAACALLAAHKVGCQPNVLAGELLVLN